MVLALAAPVYATDRVDSSKLPPAVKHKLDAVTPGERVKQITVERTQGRAVYDIRAGTEGRRFLTPVHRSGRNDHR